MLSHIRGKLFNNLDTGLRRYDAFFLMDYPGLTQEKMTFGAQEYLAWEDDQIDKLLVGRMSRRRYPPNEETYGGRRCAFPPYGLQTFEHVSLIPGRNTRLVGIGAEINYASEQFSGRCCPPFEKGGGGSVACHPENCS